MSTITEADLTTPPAGYSFHTHEWFPGVNHMWLYKDSSSYGIGVHLFPVSQLVNYYNAFKRNSDGAIIINQAGLDAAAQAQDHINSLRLIPDAQFPDGGMTEHHSEFNTTTNKFELKDLESDAHTAHEAGHDSDVAAAVAAVCGVEAKLLLEDAIITNLNADQRARAQAKLDGLHDCLEDIVDANAEPALERAWLLAHGKVTHPSTAELHVQSAHDFATQFIEYLNSRTTTQLGAMRYEYNLCVFRSLMADRGKASGRFLPKGVKIVKRKSTPAKAEEMTAAQVFNKVKALVSPAEGAPKRA